MINGPWCFIHIGEFQTKEEDDDYYHSNEEDGEMQWTKHATIEELITRGKLEKKTTICN